MIFRYGNNFYLLVHFVNPRTSTKYDDDRYDELNATGAMRVSLEDDYGNKLNPLDVEEGKILGYSDVQYKGTEYYWNYLDDFIAWDFLDEVAWGGSDQALMDAAIKNIISKYYHETSKTKKPDGLDTGGSEDPLDLDFPSITEDYAEGDEAWQEAADELANYSTIQIDDELATGNFLKYLAKQSIGATDIITVDKFITLLLEYMDKNIKTNSKIGYIFCTGDHLYLYRDDDVMHLNMSDDYSLDYFPNFEFNSDLARDIYSELPSKPSYRAYQKATLKDTVANLINIVSEAYGASSDLL